MFLRFPLQLIKEFVINLVAHFEIQINGHAVEVVADAERRSTIHYPFVVFLMVIDEVENVELQLFFQSVESCFGVCNVKAVGQKAIKFTFQNREYLVIHGNMLLPSHKTY